MVVSVFDLFSIGMGPSSSHTVGPMRAAKKFVDHLKEKNLLSTVERVKVELFGSLAFTGEGHGTDRAILLGLSGYEPATCDLEVADTIIEKTKQEKVLHLGGAKEVAFHYEEDLCFLKGKFLPFHSNAMRFSIKGAKKEEEIFYSIGGGFILSHTQRHIVEQSEKATLLPYPFTSGAVLLKLCDIHRLSIADLVRANEQARHPGLDIDQELYKIWSVMNMSIDRGLQTDGLLPGGLNLKRRAHSLHQKLVEDRHLPHPDPLSSMDWLSVYAMAVNEENAAGGRVVTAPTNGAAGVLPAVLRYYLDWIPGAQEEKITDFLLVAGAIGALYHKNASLSAAEMGCQGEVGVACSMAAAALAHILGGSPEEVEDAAEIGMEHNLGLTCDPVQGLVQIPCIERNTMGAVKAVNAARLALRGEGGGRVSLDQVIQTMFQTGKDMQTIYKETSEGGLAVNCVEC